MEENEIISNLEEVFKACDDILEKIDERESDCLRRIYVRFCLSRALLIDFKNVSRIRYADNPNKWSYYHNWKKQGQSFLMTRELIVEEKDDEKPDFRLNIIFNKILLDE